MESVHYAHYSNTAVISNALRRSHQTKLNSQQGSSTWSLQCWGWWYSMRRLIKQQKRAPTPPPRPQTSCFFFFFLHIRKKRKRGVTTANTNTLLSPLLFIMQSVTPATHTHLPLLTVCLYQISSASEGVDEKDSLDKFRQIYQQT